MVFWHVALSWQLWTPVIHSLMSEKINYNVRKSWFVQFVLCLKQSTLRNCEEIVLKAGCQKGKAKLSSAKQQQPFWIAKNGLKKICKHTRWAQMSPNSAIRVTTAWKVLISNGRHPEVCGPVELVRPNGPSFRVLELHQTCRWQCFSCWCFSASTPRVNDRAPSIKRVLKKLSSGTTHASVGRCRLLWEDRRNRFPACVWTSMSEAFSERFFSTFTSSSKNEEESIAIECPGYPLAKHEDSRTIRLRLDTFSKWKFRQPVRGRWTVVSARSPLCPASLRGFSGVHCTN